MNATRRFRIAAIEATTAAGNLTRDLGGTATTEDVTKALIDALRT
jgi:tartrate dehydrogenase/decarboxylase / D-malate dehydrogenase